MNEQDLIKLLESNGRGWNFTFLGNNQMMITNNKLYAVGVINYETLTDAFHKMLEEINIFEVNGRE